MPLNPANQFDEIFVFPQCCLQHPKTVKLLFSNELTLQQFVVHNLHFKKIANNSFCENIQY